MRILTIFFFLINFIYANAQDNLHSHLENGKYFGIFPVSDNYVCYNDSLVVTGSLNKDSLFDKAKSYFDQKEDAKYYFESEDKDAGELVYQGELNKNIFSQSTGIHFTMVLHFADSVCALKLSEVVMASPTQWDPKAYYSTSNTPINGLKTNINENATQLENLNIGKGEFSRKYCEKINNRFITIMTGLRTSLERNHENESQ
jgi:hypothetical protein